MAQLIYHGYRLTGMRHLLAVFLLVVFAAHAAAQSAPRPLWGDVFAGGEMENYLRYLQTLGVVPLYPWGLRAFSAPEIDRLTPVDTTHPWASRLITDNRQPITFSWLDPEVTARANTTFPYGFNDGPVWAGRGLTVSARAGFAARYGALSLTLAPVAFAAQNASFSLMPNGASGDLAYGDGVLSGSIDRPQRFGDGRYARLDPGQSTLRVDWRGLAAGVTTANQYWGPASEFPVILGNNAPGFPQVFVGTARPVDLWLLRLHGRIIWARLSQSPYSAETAADGVRYATGLALSLTPRGVSGLEIGFTRFSHQPWPAGGPSLRDWFAMFRGGQGDQKNLGDVNQLASVFFRWVLPESGFEVYGEYGRDDYNQNLRDFVLEPDHIGGYTIGFRKVVRRRDARLLAIRGEIQNLQFSHLAQGRGWSPFYTHSGVHQGHTQLGQVLGSEAGPGGGGSIIAVESYSPRGRWTWAWTRMLRQQRGDPAGASAPDPVGLDVQHALSVERLAFRGRYDLLARVTAVYEFHRNFGDDAFNLNLIVGARIAAR
ncbi:MAG: capsule assembly Wzi family protein [Gemmatimonadales bacterium]